MLKDLVKNFIVSPALTMKIEVIDNASTMANWPDLIHHLVKTQNVEQLEELILLLKRPPEFLFADL